jgi:uncharacterized protein YaaN involved in tellurite resistance
MEMDELHLERYRRSHNKSYLGIGCRFHHILSSSILRKILWCRHSNKEIVANAQGMNNQCLEEDHKLQLRKYFTFNYFSKLKDSIKTYTGRLHSSHSRVKLISEMLQQSKTCFNFYFMTKSNLDELKFNDWITFGTLSYIYTVQSVTTFLLIITIFREVKSDASSKQFSKTTCHKTCSE